MRLLIAMALAAWCCLPAAAQQTYGPSFVVPSAGGSGSGMSGADITNAILALAGTNAPTSSSTNALGIASTNLLWNRTIFVDATYGNNATAIRGDAAKPYLSASNAIAAAQSGDTVLFRPGSYTVPTFADGWTTNAPLKIYSKTNVIIAGMDGARLVAGGLGSMFSVGFCTNITFRDLEMTGVLTNDVSAGQSGAIWIEGTSKHLQFERININSWQNQGIVNYRHPDAGWDYQWMHVKDSRFRNIGFTNSFGGLPNDGTAIVLCGDDVEVSGNAFGPDVLRDFETFNQDAIPQIWRRYVYANNRSFGSKECAICQGATNIQDWIITGNTFKQFGTNMVSGANQTAMTFHGGQNVLIFGNTFDGGDTPIFFKTDEVGLVDKVTIQNNVFKNVFGTAIIMYRATAAGPAPKRVNIIDNQFTTVTNYGIYGQFTDGYIGRNTFLDVGVDGTSAAVYFGANGGASPATNTLVHGNFFLKSGNISYTSLSIEVGSSAYRTDMMFNRFGPGVGAIVNNGNSSEGLLGRNIFNMAAGGFPGAVWVATNSNGEGTWGIVSNWQNISITNQLTVSNIYVSSIYVTNNASFSNAVFRATESDWTIYAHSTSEGLFITNSSYGLWWAYDPGVGSGTVIGYKPLTNAGAMQLASSLWVAGPVTNLSTLTNAGAVQLGSSLWVPGPQTNRQSIYLQAGGNLVAGVGGNLYDEDFAGEKLLQSSSTEIIESVIGTASSGLQVPGAVSAGSLIVSNAYAVQTLAINSALGSTNILIDMQALLSTNTVRATLTANSGVMFTNVVDGKAITLELIQDSTGNRTVSTNATWGFNVRFGIDITGFALSTNASTKDIIRFIGSGTNALVAGNLRGFAL